MRNPCGQRGSDEQAGARRCPPPTPTLPPQQGCSPRFVGLLVSGRATESRRFFSDAQKWSKGKVKEKAANAVLFDEEVYAKLNKEVPKFKLITTSVISDRLKVRPPLLARHAAPLPHPPSRAFRSCLHSPPRSLVVAQGHLSAVGSPTDGSRCPCVQINGSLARHAIKELMAKNLIRMVTAHSAQGIYTRATNA